jgi:hypothetical protein
MDEIVVVPCTFFYVVIGTFSTSGAGYVSGEAIEESGVGGSVVLAAAAEVLVEMHVGHPMQPVLDLPMRSGAIRAEITLERGNGSRSLARLPFPGILSRTKFPISPYAIPLPSIGERWSAKPTGVGSH